MKNIDSTHNAVAVSVRILNTFWLNLSLGESILKKLWEYDFDSRHIRVNLLHQADIKLFWNKVHLTENSSNIEPI